MGENLNLRGQKSNIIEEKKGLEVKIIDFQEIFHGLKNRIKDLEEDLEAKRSENIELKREKEGIIEDKKFLEAQIRQLRVIMENLKEEVGNCYGSLTEKRIERENLMKTVNISFFFFIKILI